MSAQSDPEHTEADLTPPQASDLSVSDAFGEALGKAARRAGIDPSKESSTAQVVWAAMGGWRGVAESIIPSLAFVVAFTFCPGEGAARLVPALIISVGIALVFTVLRLAMKQPPAAALGGLAAAVVAAVFALLTGNASNNFVPGLITNAAYGVGLLVSVVIGWPIIGLAVGYLMGEGTAWRRSKRKRRAFFWLTLAWSALFFLRLGVQLPIYLSSLQPGDQTGTVALLGTLKIAMGLPLFAPLLAVTWLASRALYTKNAMPSQPVEEA